MTFVFLYKLRTPLWVARWMETGGKKHWEAKPIKMSIKARSFKAMRWFSVMCNAAQLSMHISSDPVLVNPHLSFISGVSSESVKMKLKLALGHGRVVPTVRRAGTLFVRVWTHRLRLGPCSSLCQMVKQKDWTGGWSHPGIFQKIKIPPPCIHKKKYKQTSIKNTVNMKWL